MDTSCVDKFPLTRKHLCNFIDITGDTLFWHAKDAEANCKKALALCLGETSPYNTFDGTFLSGINYEDYLLWIRKEMYSLANKVPIEDVVDENNLNFVGKEEEKNAEDEEKEVDESKVMPDDD